MTGVGERGGIHIDLRAGAGVEPGQLDTELSARFGADGSIRVAAANLPVELIAAATQMLEAAPARLRAHVYSAQPRGRVRSLQAARLGGAWQAHARVEGSTRGSQQD